MDVSLKEDSQNKIATNYEEHECNKHESSSTDDDALQIEGASIGDHVAKSSCLGELCGAKLKERIIYLYSTIENLEMQLRIEKENWKKLIEDLHLGDVLEHSPTICSCKSSAVEEYRKRLSESLKLSECRCVCKHQLMNCCHGLQYHEALKQIEEEEHFRTQKLVDIAEYRKNLQELEIMCDAELLKIKQSLESIQSIQGAIIEGSCKELAAGDGEHEDCSVQEGKPARAVVDEEEYFEEPELQQMLDDEQGSGGESDNEQMLDHEQDDSDGTEEAFEDTNSSCSVTDDGETAPQ